MSTTAPEERADLVLLHRVHRRADGTYRVVSSRSSGPVYETTLTHCTCPAGQLARRCQHKTALRRFQALYEDAGTRQAFVVAAPLGAAAERLLEEWGCRRATDPRHWTAPLTVQVAPGLCLSASITVGAVLAFDEGGIAFPTEAQAQAAWIGVVRRALDEEYERRRAGGGNDEYQGIPLSAL